MNQITYGKAEIEDVPRIALLFQTVYIETYATEGITFEFSNFIQKRFAKEHINQTIQKNPNQLLIAYFDANPIGVAEVLYNTECPIKKIPVAELDKLYVLKRFHGKGIGYGLMLECEKLVKENGKTDFNLEVYIGNDRAISFYSKLGFKKIDEVDFPMENNVYKNWVLHKTLR